MEPVMGSEQHLNLVVPAKEESEDDFAKRKAALEAHERKVQRAARLVELRALAGTLARSGLSLLFELAGVGLVAYGLFTEWPWLGITVAGLGVILVGVAIDPPSRRAPKVAPFMTPGGRYEGP